MASHSVYVNDDLDKHGEKKTVILWVISALKRLVCK